MVYHRAGGSHFQKHIAGGSPQTCKGADETKHRTPGEKAYDFVPVSLQVVVPESVGVSHDSVY